MCGLRKWTKRIIDLEEDNGLGKVIKGPWKETPVKQLDEVKSELEIKKDFAENLTQELVVHMIQMCHNSAISVDDEKAKKLVGDMNNIFDFIEKLNELNTDNVEPLISVTETTLKLRTDEVKSKNIRDQILKNSPEENEDFFVVPRVVE